MTRQQGTQGEQRYDDLALGSLLGNLPELLLAHVGAERRTALIVEAGGHRYVQFLATESHELVVECVSNHFLDDDESLDLDDALALLVAGFTPPDMEVVPHGHPNWWWFSGPGAPVMTASAMAATVLGEVFGLDATSRVTLVERPLGPRRNEDASPDAR